LDSIKKSWIGQEELLDKGAYSHLGNSRLVVISTATADADEGHSRLPKQNTGGSDALWKLPLSQGGHRVNGRNMTIKAKYRMNLKSNLLTKKGMLLC